MKSCCDAWQVDIYYSISGSIDATNASGQGPVAGVPSADAPSLSLAAGDAIPVPVYLGRCECHHPRFDALTSN